MKDSPGKKFREALKKETPLQIVGVMNAYAAKMAESAGFHALYLSGAGIANYSYGIPDIGLTTLDNVLEDAKRITSATDLPLLVDIDTGWGSLQMIEKAIHEMERIGVAGVHIEDQVFEKKCGHLDGKKIVSIGEMCERINAAVRAKSDHDFVVMARTDAYANEGVEGLLERAGTYHYSGADMLFPEALPELSLYEKIKERANLPLLANLTEFGKTPLFSLKALEKAHVDIALYPLSAHRAMNAAALKVYRTIRKKGTQATCLKAMQTRKELYEFLNYDPNQ